MAKGKRLDMISNRLIKVLLIRKRAQKSDHRSRLHEHGVRPLAAGGSRPTFTRMGRPFLTAYWKNLLMANYEVDPAVLLPYLPCGTELDTFNGRHYVSLVGFLFDATRVAGIAIPFHTSFEEVNLRFYVRYKQDGQWKRGVVFLKEIVPRRMISFVANTLYGENYTTHQMKHHFISDATSLQVEYRWKVGNDWNFLKAAAAKMALPLVQGSAEEFITEHYWGYTFINKTCSGTYEVQHPRWNIHAVEKYEVYCRAEKLYGPAFTGLLDAPPASVFLAAGSPVAVMKGAKIYGS